MNKFLTTGSALLMAILLMGALACGPAAQPDIAAQNPATQAPPVRSNSPFQIPATLVPGFQPDTPVSGSDTQTPPAQPDAPGPSQPGMVETPAPIDGVELVVSEDDPPQYVMPIAEKEQRYTPQAFLDQVPEDFHTSAPPAGRLCCPASAASCTALTAATW